MNIFFLAWCVAECARAHFNRHVTKMIVEYAQILSTAHRMLDSCSGLQLTETELLAATHANHPAMLWARAHVNNYRWLARLALALCAEKTRRYGTPHSLEPTLRRLAQLEPRNIERRLDGVALHFEPRVTMPPQCFGKEAHLRVDGDPVTGYRAYYASPSKRHLRWWRPTLRAQPLAEARRDDSVDYVPSWFAGIGGLADLSAPLYYLRALEQPAERKRRRSAAAPGVDKRPRIAAAAE